MESHEERLHKMIIQSKINETKDVMKRKAMEIDKSKLSEAKARPWWHCRMLCHTWQHTAHAPACENQ